MRDYHLCCFDCKKAVFAYDSKGNIFHEDKTGSLAMGHFLIAHKDCDIGIACEVNSYENDFEILTVDIEE